MEYGEAMGAYGQGGCGGCLRRETSRFRDLLGISNGHCLGLVELALIYNKMGKIGKTPNSTQTPSVQNE